MEFSAADLVWRALADPTRRALLDHLAQRPHKTGELVEAIPELSRTGVMKHLDVLQEANLVLVRREGRTRWNYLNPVPIQQVCERWVSRHVRGLASSMARLKRVAEELESPSTLPEESPETCKPRSRQASPATNSKSPSRPGRKRSGKH